MDVDRLARLLAGEIAPANDEDRGALVLVALNYQALRRQEDRERYEQTKRMVAELEVGRGAAGQAA